MRAANLLASFIIIPMAMLIQGESVIMFWASYSVLWWVILADVMIAGLLVRTGLAYFNREELLGRELDSLNFRWGLRLFWRAFRGRAASPWDWYRGQVFPTVRTMLLPAGAMAVALVLAVWAGAQQAAVFVLPPDLLRVDQLGQGFVEGLDAVQFLSLAGVATIFLHNLRAVLIATVLGVFSFGVVGVIVLMLPLVVIGYFMGSAAAVGLAPGLFLTAFVLPHGLFELPAICLAGAAILRLGATLATPAEGKTIGEAWLLALADGAKVVLGVALPLFLAAAFVETLVTPHVVARLFGN